MKKIRKVYFLFLFAGLQHNAVVKILLFVFLMGAASQVIGKSIFLGFLVVCLAFFIGKHITAEDQDKFLSGMFYVVVAYALTRLFV